MSQACGCGRCYGCRLAWEAGERNDTTDDEARVDAEREAEEQERAEELASYAAEPNELDGVGLRPGPKHAPASLPVELRRRSGDLPSSPAPGDS